VENVESAGEAVGYMSLDDYASAYEGKADKGRHMAWACQNTEEPCVGVGDMCNLWVTVAVAVLDTLRWSEGQIGKKQMCLDDLGLCECPPGHIFRQDC
jgi:hypothetical protein